MTQYAKYFSDSWSQARDRFCQSVSDLGGSIISYKIGSQSPSGEELTIDVGRIGAADAPNLLVISSGTHGVEGFFGAAVQLAHLNGQVMEITQGGHTAVLLIHAVNPFGFSHIRRVNEDNIDLNRNGMIDGEEYSGADPGYARLDPMLNPNYPPKKRQMFLPTALWNIAKHGLPTLKNSVAQGQYEFPKGLFFGGKQRSASLEIIATNFASWVGSAKNILHLDMHTGLGKWGTYVLASPVNTSIEDNQKSIRFFGADVVQALDNAGVLYTIRGEFGAFCRSLVPDKQYVSILAEFGTYNVLKVIAALREENQNWHWSTADSAEWSQSKENLMETFCPQSAKWKHTVVEKSLNIVVQAMQFLKE